MKSVRDSEQQLREPDVPEKFLDGHAYHWVDLVSPDKSVGIRFHTQVNGRRTYADGTPDAVRYLHRKVQEDSQGEIFSMVDVLRNR